MITLEQMRDLPQPTPDQQQAFVDYIKTAHSWYKHLPLLDGGTFIVFLSPKAGIGWEQIISPQLPFGNSVERYCKSFGFLDYICMVGGNQFLSRTKTVELPDRIYDRCTFKLYPYVYPEYNFNLFHIHKEAMTSLHKGAYNPAREQLLRWESVALEIENRRLTPSQNFYSALMGQAENIHCSLQAEEMVKIWNHLDLLFKCVYEE